MVGAVLLMAVALVTTACSADPAPPHRVSASESAEGMSPAAIPPDLRGRTVQLTYDSGPGGTAVFAEDGRHLTYVAADTGRKTTAAVVIEPIEAGIFLVTWADDDTGTVVSQVQDYRTGKVRSTWTRRSDANAPFVIDSRLGSVRLTD
ncbi:MoaF-related domain-containing protein [Nocardia yamanashiensis]|uniref:MoaF-related domain-containing protein n=1 Tax=Nocardia yamanashiensis TaxID=209247 RepID=UPI00082F326E|nr:MoaF N-terminal domain-containing protein [Nocardia yamanashiensis]